MADRQQKAVETERRQGEGGYVLVLWAMATSFATYFCMYAFRKPFAAGEYEGLEFLGIEIKTTFVISQIVGYALAKFVGIKVCSEAPRQRRALLLVIFILWAEGALVLFAVLPPALKVVAIFLNGVPLGLVWGLVVWYLEGRRTSELLLAGLSCSFIMASGIVKDVGRNLLDGIPSCWTGFLDLQVIRTSEWWMPATTGLLFLPVFLLSVALLNQTPLPDETDIRARVEREPMDGSHRRRFVLRFLPGLVLLLVVYFFLTAYRDFRDNFGVEIINSLGYREDSTVFTRTETLVAFGVLIPLALLVLIRNNRLGLAGAFAIMTAGVAILGGSSLLFEREVIDGELWMTLVGLGAYLTYVPYGSVLFDRLVASTRVVGTAVFTIYVADAIGYTGAISVLLYREFLAGDESKLGFFRGFTYALSLGGMVLLIASCVYFVSRRRSRTNSGLLPGKPESIGPL